MGSCGYVARTVVPGSPLADDASRCVLLCLAPSPVREGVAGVALRDVGAVSQACTGPALGFVPSEERVFLPSCDTSGQLRVEALSNL